MPNRKASRNAYYFFVQEKIPELRQRGLPVARVADAIPYCSADWALLREEDKEKYADMAREWRAAQGKDCGPSEKQRPVSTPLRRPAMLVPKQNISPPDMSSLSLQSDQALLGGIFYFLNIFSHGELPPHCGQRFLPCEIGCIKYSLQEGIMADFHSFINPGEIPRGFRFHCQAARENASEFFSLLQSDDRARVNWCLKHMARASEVRQDLELLTVEDLVVGIYQQKFLKEASKTWVRSLLDVAMWDYSSNTRCKWHEENDILFCALAVCKKIAYCISNSLATHFGIQLTEAHVPLQDYEASSSVTPKMVVLDAGRYQKLRFESPGFSPFNSSNQEQRSITPTGDCPSGVKPSGQTSGVRGRGITRLLESISSAPGGVHGFPSCETALAPHVSPKDGHKPFSSLSE
nr:PREDICTED: protein maelstrom homolog [Rhinolophus sinicus]